MLKKHYHYYLQHLPEDIPAGVVVFLVALPLCLGIAMASNAPLFSGVISGIVGGLVVSWISGSQLSVSGPAAGLAVVVVHSIEKLGNFENFLLAVSIAGIMQLAMGYLKAGSIGAYFPASVIKGMLAAIGILLIMKQIPHVVGYDADYIGDESFHQADTRTTFSEIGFALRAISPGATIVTLVALFLMLVWESAWVREGRFLRLIPGPLVAVVWGVAYNWLAMRYRPELAIRPEQVVNLPRLAGPGDVLRQLSAPNFSAWLNPEIYSIAFTLAVVASLETLLSLEAVDKIDPLKRVAPANRELKAQGMGNLLCGLLGGLPMTSVIVRSSANVGAGGRTKVSCFVHGVCLLASVTFFSLYLNLIPQACLAAILLLTGCKLARPSLFKSMYAKGFNQFTPFVFTIIAILISDLLKGMAFGLALGLFFVVRANFRSAISLTRDGNNYLIRLNKDVSFLNKSLLRSYLSSVERDSNLIIDGSRARFVDRDILEAIGDFLASAPDGNITVELKNLSAVAELNYSSAAH